jgi:hypothetical protein
MDEREFFIPLHGIDAALRVRYEKEHGQVIRFVVQLEAYLNEIWTPIARYDNAHRFVHRDDLKPDGTQIKSPPMSFDDNQEALNYALDDFRLNSRLYIERYRQWLR